MCMYLSGEIWDKEQREGGERERGGEERKKEEGSV